MRETEQPRQIRMRTHSVQMEDRARVSITDVEEVESFNETEVLLMTGAGSMTVAGEGLHITKLNLEEGQLVVEGNIASLEYEQQGGGGLFGRLFK